jgi:hypothetical protein
MGRQIYFFLIGKDEEDFLDYVLNKGDSIIDSKGKQLSKEEIIKEKPMSVYIKPAQARIITRASGFVEDFESNVIDFHRSRFQLKNPQKFQSGRLWIELIGYATNGTTYRKEKWVEDDYNYYKKWILKHCKISKDKGFYISGTAYRLYKEEGYKMVHLDYEVEFD